MEHARLAIAGGRQRSVATETADQEAKRHPAIAEREIRRERYKITPTSELV